MFTGIIECLGTIRSVSSQGSGRSFWISSSITPELKVDQSIAHNGACLTIEALDKDLYQVTAVEETLLKTTLGSWNTGDSVNLERCLIMNGRLDGHIVQGHVDTVATCTGRTGKQGSWEFEFEFPEEFSHLIVEKGSIGVNGISLTAFNVKRQTFSVAIIPYTFDHTNMHNIHPGSKLNLEFDLIGKYVARLENMRDRTTKSNNTSR